MSPRSPSAQSAAARASRRSDGTPDASALESIVDEIQSRQPGDPVRQHAICVRYPVEIANYRRQAYRQLGLLPVPINGSANRGLKAGYFMKRLADGTLGYLQRRADDCLQAAIASCLQIPMHKVPNLRIEAQLMEGKDPGEIDRSVHDKMSRWMDEYGVRIMVQPSSLPTSGRWIGVVPHSGLYSDHCLIMAGKQCLWDTTGLMDGTIRARLYDGADIDYAITFS